MVALAASLFGSLLLGFIAVGVLLGMTYFAASVLRESRARRRQVRDRQRVRTEFWGYE